MDLKEFQSLVIYSPKRVNGGGHLVLQNFVSHWDFSSRYIGNRTLCRVVQFGALSLRDASKQIRFLLHDNIDL